MVKKAVVPIAGRGTRLAPMTEVLPKALFPLVDVAGRCRPVLHWIAAEAAAAGVEELAVVVSPWQRQLVEAYLAAGRSHAPVLPGRIELLVQPTPSGFGDAVARAEAFVGGENFLLLLGDHVYVTQTHTGKPVSAGDANLPCARQVLRAFEQTGGTAMVGMQPVGEEELCRVGVARGEPVSDHVYRCRAFIEKPTPAQAHEQLATPGLAAGQYLAHSGIYAFTAEIFDCLGRRTGVAEITLADAQSELLRRHEGDYYLCRIDGRALDTGTPEGYARAMAEFARGQQAIGNGQ